MLAYKSPIQPRLEKSKFYCRGTDPHQDGGSKTLRALLEVSSSQIYSTVKHVIQTISNDRMKKGEVFLNVLA